MGNGIAVSADAPRFVIALASIALSDADTRQRIPIAKIGTYYKGKQKFSITRTDIQQMAENFAKRGTGEVVLDYDHASEHPEDAQGQPIPAAGWVKSIESEPDANGIVWGAVEFTDQARELIRKREYKYISPYINWGVTDRATGERQGATITSVALTNRPFLDQMPAIQLSDAGWTNEEQGVNVPKDPQKCECGEGLLCSKCNADQFKRLAASDRDSGLKVIALSDVKRDSAGRIDLSALDSNAVMSMEVFNRIETERVALSEVAEAVRAGKITPAQRPGFERIALNDIDAFRAVVKTMTPQVDLRERGVAGTGEEAGEGNAAADMKLASLARQIATERKIGFSSALHLAASEHPKLVAARNRALTVSNFSGREDGEGGK